MPKVDTNSMKPGNMKVFHTEKIAYLAWLDKKVVNMLTILQKPEIINTGKRNLNTNNPIMKPNAAIR